MKLSIIIPAYNEEKTLLRIIEKIKKTKLPLFEGKKIEKEIILVDDCSDDGTREILKNIKEENIKIYYHKKNQGKGRAIRTGLEKAKGDMILIQDADLEYNPSDYGKLIEPILSKEAKVVYGSRILGENKTSSLIFYFGGKVITFISNLLYNTKITDEPTCYKVFRADIIKNIELKSEGFEFCPEITAKVAKRKIKIKEVPISYNPRTKKQGKKIKIKDGIIAIWTLFKYKFRD